MSLRHTQGNGFRLSVMADKGSDMYWRQYTRDGTGRDNYVAFNNGAFNSGYYEPSKQLSTGMQTYVGGSQGGTRSDVYPPFPGKTINYNVNGTGRDSYIAKSNGGFYPELSTAAYSLNFKDQLRVSHFKNREATIDYLQRRDQRMSNVIKNNSNIHKMSDRSPENHNDRASLMEKLSRGSNSGNMLLQSSVGFITNQRYKQKQDQKQLFQTVHSSFLAKPKKQAEKYNSPSKLNLSNMSNSYLGNTESPVFKSMSNAKQRATELQYSMPNDFSRKTSNTSQNQNGQYQKMSLILQPKKLRKSFNFRIGSQNNFEKRKQYKYADEQNPLDEENAFEDRINQTAL